jgi:hypothetical protein
MATFGGTPFDMEMPSYPRERRANISVRPIPGGDDFVVDYSGKGPATIRPLILATDANYTALDGKVGDEATLVYEGGTVQAVLMALSSALRYDDDSMQGEAEFLLLS